ncbi:MAG: 5'-nucleotidase C-terminal domain-containing protein [Hyphomicrobiaceae bacterium]|nr:5'-nucleotidase C-terminal domain-containing protein [Hyphomicrobiaceae bacterium]
MPPARKPSRRDVILAAAKLGLVTVLSPRDLLAQSAPAAPATTETGRITLVLVNDLDRMGDRRGRGGHAKLATIVNAERARGNTLFVHAGDAISPSILAGFDKGFHIIDILNRIAPDIFTPGNHEFDFGAANFRARMKQATFDVIAANILEKDGALVAGLTPTKTIEVGGFKIAFVGVTTEETAFLSTAEDIRFSPAVTTAAELARKLRNDGADIVVAVTHMGFDDDMALVRTGAADVVLSGHDHNLVTFWNGKVALVESASQADFVTPVDLLIERSIDNGAKRVSFVPNFRPTDTMQVPADPMIASVIASYEAELDKELGVIIGRTETALDTRGSVVRREEAAFGNLVCDAMRTAVSADICITNGGGFRANRTYPAGADLTRRDVFEEMPFGNKTVLLEVSGATLRAALDHGVTGDGRFPHVSGLVVDADAAAAAGSRVKAVSVNGAPLDDAKLYKLATNDFMARGGDGYDMLKRARTLIDNLAAQYVAGQVIAYITKAGTISPRVEGRIKLAR